MKSIATERGGECLSDRYVNNRTKLLWCCSCDHKWWAIPNSIKLGKWCPVCAGSMKHTLKDAQQTALKKGGKCLSKEYKDNKTKLHWECSKGHQWKAPYQSISQGHWCPVCAEKLPLTIEEMKALAAKKGGECLSDKYKNNKTKLLWRCSCDHEWWTTPNNIKRGGWCPACRRK